MEIDSQCETAENGCPTTMRSQQLSSPAPPSEELRQTGLNTAVALVNAAPADLSLRDLDDVTLDHEIAEQEGLVASNPSMAKYMQLSLQLHQAERQRRNVALGPALLAVAQPISTPTGAAEAAQAVVEDALHHFQCQHRQPQLHHFQQFIISIFKLIKGNIHRSCNSPSIKFTFWSNIYQTGRLFIY